jgi:hypothetical protein
MVPVGWGEGLEPVARFVDPATLRPGTIVAPESVRLALQAQVGARVVGSSAHNARYQVLYVNAVQRGQRPRRDMPRTVLTIRLNGVEYARLRARE